MSGNGVNRFSGVSSTLDVRTDAGFGPLKKIGVPEPETRKADKPDRAERKVARLEARLAELREKIDRTDDNTDPTPRPSAPASSHPFEEIRNRFAQNPSGLVDALLGKMSSLEPSARASSLHVALQPMTAKKFDAAMEALTTPEERQAFRAEHSSCATDDVSIGASHDRIQESVSSSIQTRLRDNTRTPSMKLADGTILVPDANDKANVERMLAEERPRGMKGPGAQTFEEYVNALVPGAQATVRDGCVTVKTSTGIVLSDAQKKAIADAAHHLFGTEAAVTLGEASPGISHSPLQSKAELAALLPSVKSASDWKQFQAYLRAKHGYNYPKSGGVEDGVIGKASLSAANKAVTTLGQAGLEKAFLEWKNQPENEPQLNRTVTASKPSPKQKPVVSPSALARFSESPADDKWTAVKNPAIAQVLQRELEGKGSDSKTQMNWFYNAAKNEHEFAPKGDEESGGVSHFSTYMMHNNLATSLKQLRNQEVSGSNNSARNLLLSCGYTSGEINGFKQEDGSYRVTNLPSKYKHQRLLLEQYGVGIGDIQELLATSN